MVKSLQDRLDLADSLFIQGNNCAQSVAGVFDDIPDFPDAAVMRRLLAGLGGGFAARGLTCGAVSSAVLLDGLIVSRDATKAERYKRASALIDDFAALNGGLTTCRDLKRDRISCRKLIAQAVTLLHNRLADES